MRRAVCSGSFDPVTKGHLDIIERASRMFDEIIVCVFYNPTKDKSLFTPEERVAMLKTATRHLPNVVVESYSGLLNDFCVARKAPFIVRGLRAFTDFEYEFQRALLLKKINESLETVFIMTNAAYSYISSSGVREILAFDGDIDMLVPKGVSKQVRQFMKNKHLDSCN
ncbi:MAG: Phosphopantetheine adenylyltransferase [Succiniclasticum sp.]|jgi:pantetheine-phosphate adenylyltransferase